ncbi:hypothetical protein [Motiliproteus sp. SC1-56]|uniref:hypothetical protein n=1 Tax=Motiliproteus sp. SC1-56 TaxID=2799565 RepID=UPI001A8DE966|nr:hypothetical protein [Motiliproteus sp. SC1-56]
MNRSSSALVLFVGVLILFSLQAKALQAAPEKPAATSQALLQQKYALLQHMLEHSASTQRIEQGANDLARERLNHARDQLRVAQQALEAGQLDAAREKINQAMQFYSSAAGNVADPTDKGEAQQTRFKELSVSIESFRLYVQRAMVKSEDDNPLDGERLDNLLQLASHLADHGNYGQANELLNEAYMLTITAVSALKGGTTIVYSQDFDTPEQEYLYELERYKGLQKLFKLLSPSGELPAKYQWTRPSLDESAAYFDQAQTLAGRADYPQALEQLNEASKKLTQVLRLLGLPLS